MDKKKCTIGRDNKSVCWLSISPSHFPLYILANVYRTCTSISVPLTLKLCVLFADEWLASTKKKLLLYVRYVDNFFLLFQSIQYFTYLLTFFYRSATHTRKISFLHTTIFDFFFRCVLFGSTRKTIFTWEEKTKAKAKKFSITKRNFFFSLFSTQTRTRNE